MQFEIPEMEVVVFTTEDVMNDSGNFGSESDEEPQTGAKSNSAGCLL